MKIIFLIIVTVSFLLIIPNFAIASNLLQNYDFESGNIDSWSTSGGSSTATVSAQLVHNGSYSIKIQHDKTSFYGFQQVVSNIEGNKYYKISGYVASNNDNTSGYLIRLAWYTSTDASGSQMSGTSDTEEINQTNGNWSEIEDVLQAPSAAQSTKVRLVLKSKTGGILTSAFFDDLSFEQVPDPTPSSTPVPTTTSTPTNTPTKTFTPTPTKKPTATPTKKPTLTPTKNIQENTQTSDVNLPQSILGTTTSPSPSPSPTPAKPQTSIFSFTNLLIISGGIVLILAGVFVFTFIAKDKSN